MKKLVALYTFFSLFLCYQCIPFKESELDPNSQLSWLYQLFLLSRLNSGINYYVIDTEVLSGTDRYNGNEINRPFLRVTKLIDNGESGYSDNPVIGTEFSQGTFIGTFWNSGDGLVRIYLRDPGKYRLDFYTSLVNRAHSGVAFFEVNSNFTIQNLKPIGTTISGYTINFLKTYREIKEGEIFSLDWKSQFVKSVGNYGAVDFFLSFFIFNKDFYIDSTEARSLYFPGVYYTRDGDKWEGIFLSEFKANLSLNTSGQSIFSTDFGTVTGTDQEVFLLMNKFNGDIDFNNLASQHLVRLPTSDPKNYSVQTLTAFNPGFRIYTEYPIFTDGSRIVYTEFNSATVTVSLVSSDFNFNSRFTITPPVGDTPNDFIDFSTGGYPNTNPLRSVFMQDSNLFSVGLTNSYSYVNTSGANGASTYSNADVLFTPNTSSIYGTKNFLFRDHDGFSPVRLAVLGALPIKIASPGTPLIFPTNASQGPTYVKELGTNGLPQLQTTRTVQSSNNRMLAEYDLTASGYPIVRIMYTAGAGFQEIVTNTSKFRPIPPNYTESSIARVSFGNFGVSDGRLVLAYIPSYTTPAGNRAENIILHSKSTDGNNWSDWKVVDFKAFVR